MLGRSFVPATLCKSRQLQRLFFYPFIFQPVLAHSSPHQTSSLYNAMCKVFERGGTVGPNFRVQKCDIGLVNSGRYFCTSGKSGETSNGSGNDAVAVAESCGEFKEDKIKRKKLKGKREVVKWLKFFRWKKKKELQRMTAEEKILFKLSKARKKEERLLEALKKVEPKEISEATHDPEILTPEEHFYFLKMGEKCKNYVPVGRRGIYQGVILNMHLHWKKHQTLKVVVKTFSPEEVKEIAADLARLSGGIVLDIQDDNTIIMYRGKNYSQPPTEIMSPRSTLSRKKALDKSKYRDSLRAVKTYIPRLEQDLELLQLQAENKTGAPDNNQETGFENFSPAHCPDQQIGASDKLKRLVVENEEQGEEEDSMVDTDIGSASEDLSDIFETDCEEEDKEKIEEPLYLDVFEKFPVQGNGDAHDFEEDLLQISSNSRREKSSGKDVNTPALDEVDRMILQAVSLLKKKRR
ncbi:putative CRM domain-containing protein At3g25440, chloroplastic isoform X1 [Nicotiana tabacum]|uniref:CRM domain-containing protein At3g25440, chloroplastic isoform X1 n=1 Tax=Nicotiana tabacum TaxID=4097 RepID=A0AC58RR17_TOBAC